MGGGLVALIAFTSCENFLVGAEVRKEIEENIAYNNAKDINVLIMPEIGTGTIVQNTNYTAKLGYSFEISFAEASEYSFVEWIAVDKNNPEKRLNDGVIFDDARSATTKVKISTDSIAVKIIPSCEKRIALSVEPSPRYDPLGVSRDRSITVTFTKSLAKSSFIYAENEIPAGAQIKKNEDGEIWAYTFDGQTYLKNISITNADDYSIAEHFTCPLVNDKLLTIAVDKNEPIKFNSGEVFKTVKVTLSKDICDTKGIKMNTEKSWNYQITESTDDKASVNLTSDKGSVYLAGTKDYSIGQKITLALTEDADYQFVRWDYDSSIIYIAEPTNPNTTATVLEKTQGENTTQIKAICAPRLRVLDKGFSPLNDSENPTVSKNSSIVITFNQNLPDDEEGKKQLENISITIGGSPIKSSFKAPVISENTVTFAADNSNMLDVPAGQTKTVSVTVPADLYYKLDDGTKICYGANGISFNYKIDETTLNKAEIIVSAASGSGTLKGASGSGRYSIGQEVSLVFEPADGWQFNGWSITCGGEAVPESQIKIADKNALSTKLTVYEALAGLLVTAKTSECLSFTASPSAVVNPKDSEIKITFNKNLAPECALLLDKILINSGDLDVYYATREFDGNTITIKNTIPLSVAKDTTKLITVTVPSDFYYMNDGNKVNLERKSFSFKVDYTTNAKTKVTYSVINGEEGVAFNPSNAAGSIEGVQSYCEYNIGEEVPLSFALADGYQFYGWKITDANGNLVTDTVSYKNDTSASSLQPTLEMNKPAESLKISAVCYKRPSISTANVSPYNANSVDPEPKNTPISLTFAHAIEEGREQYIEIKYSVSSFSQSTYFSRTLSSDKKTVTFTPIKMLPVENAFETVTVTVPHDMVYYLAQDGKTKITPSDEDFSWSYRVNSSTMTKTIVRLDTTDANGSSINVNNIGLAGGTNQTVNVEESHSLVYPLAQGYKFMGWKLTCATSGYTVSESDYVTSGTITVNIGTKPYFTLTIDSSDPTKATIKSYDAIGNGTGNYGLTIAVKHSLLPKITATGPAYSTGGIDCDTSVTVTFNKAINTSTVTLGSSGTIQIVDPANENEHYESYFNTPSWSENTVTIKPKYTIQELVSNGLGPKTLKVKFNLSSIKDSDGNAVTSSPESFTYRINDAVETVQPVWYSTATLYSDNTSSKRTLSTTAYSSWSYSASGSYTYGTCSQNHVGNSVYFTMYGYDLTSGIKALRITETYYKSNTDQNVTSSSVVSEIATKTLYSSSYNGIYKFDDTYTFKTTADGVIKLDFQLVDNAGNVNTAKTWYVIKDTYIDTANFAPYIDLHIANNNSATVVMQMSSGKEGDKFFQRSSGYALFADTLVEVYWGYALNSLTIINPTIIDEWTKKYTFTHSADKLTYIKIIATDAVKNRQERIFAVPPNADVGKCTYSNSNGYITVSPNNASLYKSLADTAGANNFTVGVFTVEDGKAISWDNAVDWNDANEDEKEYSFYPSYNGLENGKTYRVYMRIAFKYEDGGRIYSALSSNYAKIVVGSDGTVSSYTIINPNGTFSNSNYFKDPVSVTKTAVKGSGCYTVTVQDFRSSLSVSTTDISYSVKAVNTSTSETFVQDGFSINLPSPGTYKLYMIAKKTNGQTATSGWLYAYVNGASSYNSSYSLSLTGDLTPPDMGTTTSWISLVLSSPNALTLFYQSDWSGWYGYPIDASTSLKDTITYYILPPSVSYCTESELAAYPKKTVTFNTSQTSWSLPHDSSARQGLIELPYGDLDEGTYTICVVAEDAIGNKATRFLSVSNRLSNQKLDWSYNSSTYVITTNKLSCVFYYYDTTRNRWVFWKMGNNNTNSLTASTSDVVNKWVKVWGYNSGNSGGAYNDVEYVYLGSSVTCNNKNIMELQNGLQVFCDQSTFAHTLYSTKKLTETNTAADITKWENKGIETGIKISSTNFTYGSENLNGVPSGCYYTTVVHFRDGTKLMTEVKQK